MSDDPNTVGAAIKRKKLEIENMEAESATTTLDEKQNDMAEQQLQEHRKRELTPTKYGQVVIGAACENTTVNSMEINGANGDQNIFDKDNAATSTAAVNDIDVADNVFVADGSDYDDIVAEAALDRELAEIISAEAATHASASQPINVEDSALAQVAASPNELPVVVVVDDTDDTADSPSNAVNSDSDTDSDATIPSGPEERASVATCNREKSVLSDMNEILSKPKPAYEWNSAVELRKRECGLIAHNVFKAGFYSSRLVVERMELSRSLQKHTGCVNSLNFNRSGNLLCSGSDDSRIIVWDWAKNKTKHVARSGHSDNIFQTKFIDSDNALDIVSASRDGQVRRTIINPAGGKGVSSSLYKHRSSVHKLLLCQSFPQEIISVGEDGFIRHKDLRSATVTDMLRVMSQKMRRVELYGGAHHPYAPEICVCGADEFVRVYDKRNMSKTVHQMSPTGVHASGQVTSCVYNFDGSEVLGTYSSDHIYLFNNKNYAAGSFLHRYMGHRNQRTIKGVNFYGLNSEYIISGSDCGHIFIWDKNTEAIINFLDGDKAGVVNCLEPHPHVPMIATSGLDSNIKLWTPTSVKYPPQMEKLADTIKKNLRNNKMLAHSKDHNQFNFIVNQLFRRLGTGRADDDDSITSFDDLIENSSFSDDSSISANSTSSDSLSTSDDEDQPVQGVQCQMH